MHKFISSLQNPQVKQLIQLQEKSRNRRREGQFVVEGSREIKLALEAEYSFNQFYYCPSRMTKEDLDFFLSYSSVEAVEVSEAVYRKLAYRNGTEGILALGIQKSHALKDLKFSTEKPLLLVAEAPEKPGNIGALLRTADAAQLDAVLIANPKTDLYNPNIIRSSVGCVFTNKIATGTTEEIIAFLKDNQLAIYCATLQSSKIYTSPDYSEPSALVVGTEAEGLSEEWRAHSTQNIIIPMFGKIDSMNVSVAAGILIYEAKRQRGF